MSRFLDLYRNAKILIQTVFCGIYYKLILRMLGVKINGNLSISGRMKIEVHSTAQIRFGKIRINSGNLVNSFGGHRRMVVRVLRGGQLIIGDNVGMSNSTIICADNITIDDDVLIGGNCHIFDTDFHSIDYTSRMTHPDPDVRTRPVHIKKGAFVGGGSYIVKGVVIGEQSVIAAGSVVTKSVPDGELWGGNPAKFIRQLGLS